MAETAAVETFAPVVMPRIVSLVGAMAWSQGLAIPGVLPVLVGVAVSIAILLMVMMIMRELAEAQVEAKSDATDCECAPEPKPPECACTFEQVPHKGGNSRSNTCADTTGPNLFPLMDTVVCTASGECISYDTALPDGQTYCEVKAYDFDRNEFLINKTTLLADDATQSLTQQVIAAQCGIHYCYVVADPRHVPIVSSWGVQDIRVRPECLTFP